MKYTKNRKEDSKMMLCPLFIKNIKYTREKRVFLHSSKYREARSMKFSKSVFKSLQYISYLYKYILVIFFGCTLHIPAISATSRQK